MLLALLERSKLEYWNPPSMNAPFFSALKETRERRPKAVALKRERLKLVLCCAVLCCAVLCCAVLCYYHTKKLLKN
ncbi:hypothetical protein HBZS_104080 [Helicobacter bizzozeronii CCUG 35545]|nr:hypothetical protein HBZS_104080 [Helicobacter bizzozeronii CCUG 35545]